MRVSRKASQLWLVGILSAAQAAGQEFIISTVAGGAPPPTPVAATAAAIGGPLGVAADAAGNVYFLSSNYCVFKRDTAGVLTLIAGNSRPGFSGDGGPATSAQLNFGGIAVGLAVDNAGNVYIADTENQRIRRVSPYGIITTVAGTGDKGFSGDGGPAVSARLNNPTGVAVDGAGNLYIGDAGNDRIRRVSSSGVITTAPGTHGTSGWRDTLCVAVDGDGNIYISDYSTVRRVTPSGDVRTFADDLFNPSGIAVDNAGSLYIADTNHYRVRHHPTTAVIGGIYTVAGTGDGGFSGDGGPATLAQLGYPVGLATDGAGNLYIADRNNRRIRRVSPSTIISASTITTVAGNGVDSYSGDGGPATSAQINASDVAVDGVGSLYLADTPNHRIRRVSSSGIITTVVGTGQAGYSGDGGLASSAQLNSPGGVALDAAGNLYIAEYGNHRIRRVSTAGIISTVAGNGTDGFSGDGGPATLAQIGWPHDVSFDAVGNLYIAGDLRIRRVSPSGIITTVAGNGIQGYSGDGGPATSAKINAPSAVVVDQVGNIYIGDSWNYRVRRVSPSGIITTVAGTGDSGYSGDGGPATSARMGVVDGLALDAAGNLYIADRENRIRRVSPSGIITTVAGTGVNAYSGDGGPATSAEVASPNGLAVDSANRIYFTQYPSAVRMLTPISCAASATPTTFNAPLGGGPLTLTIQATQGCGWTITGLPAWITASATAGSGAATVTLTVMANWVGTARSTTITAAGTTVTISQAGGGGLCVPPSISPVEQAFSSAGGTGSFTVSIRTGCNWSAVSSVAWITITSGGSGSADGTVGYQVLPNTQGVPRSGTITVAGTTFTVQQASATSQCGYSVSCTNLGVAASGGTVGLLIHSDPGCAWSVSGLPPWLVVSGSSQGNGSGSVSLVAASNPGGARSASISIGGVSVPIRQFDSSACGGSSACVARAITHVAAGGEWATNLFAVSSGTTAGAFAVSFYGDDGSSLALPFMGGGNLSTLSDSVPAQGRKDYEVGSASLPLRAGWGLLIAEKSITVQAAFRRATPAGSFYEAAVPASEGYSGFIIPFDASAFPPTGGSLYTGFAIANLNPNQVVHVMCTARDQWGTVIPNAVTIPELKPSGHYASYLFPALTGKRGTLDCTADTLVSAIALRSVGTDAFSTLPVIVK